MGVKPKQKTSLLHILLDFIYFFVINYLLFIIMSIRVDYKKIR